MPPERLRIAIDGRPAMWPRTGIGTLTRNILKDIQNFDNTNQYFAYFDADPALSSNDLRWMESKWGGPRQELAWANTWLPRQLARDRIDVFVTFLDKEVPLFPTRARIVSMIHDLIPLRLPDVVFRNLAHRIYYNLLIRASARRAHVILTNSDHSRQEIVNLLGTSPGKIRKITLGADPAPVADRAAVEAVLQRYQLHSPFVLALGSSEPRKNNLRVIEAMRRLEPDYPQLQLALAGGHWRGQNFSPELVTDHVRLLGHVSDADLPLLMQSAAMLVFPSLHEGFGLPVVEAMAAGLPVVTSNRAALPEVAGDAALLVDPTDVGEIAAAVRRILDDADLAASLRARGRARAGRFRWDTTCAEIVSVCEELMHRNEWRSRVVTL